MSDPIDFGALYRRYAEDVRRFALFLSGEPAVADDIVSETFVRVWGARERVDLATVRAYLLAIARNVYLHDLRRARSREAGTADLGIERTGDDPEHRRVRRRELETVLGELQRLPEPERTAVLLRAQEVSYEEIAATLGISPGAARVKVHRARLRLAAARDSQKTEKEIP
jgi:RNA polymerase sigma-70 factor (ECF subfamily)